MNALPSRLFLLQVSNERMRTANCFNCAAATINVVINTTVLYSWLVPWNCVGPGFLCRSMVEKRIMHGSDMSGIHTVSTVGMYREVSRYKPRIYQIHVVRVVVGAVGACDPRHYTWKNAPCLEYTVVCWRRDGLSMHVDQGGTVAQLLAAVKGERPKTLTTYNNRLLCTKRYYYYIDNRFRFPTKGLFLSHSCMYVRYQY